MSYVFSAIQEGCEEGSTDPNCPTKNAFVPVVVAVYMLVANVFLINVLIAVFRFALLNFYAVSL